MKFKKGIDKTKFICYNIRVVKIRNKGGNNMKKGTPKISCGKWAYITKKVRNKKIRRMGKNWKEA